MDKVFDAKNLKRLRKLVKKTVGLELNDDDLYACAISVIRLTCSKILRSQGFQNNTKEVNNGREVHQ